ncbi:hypothetical protein [Kitasatospora purpeofusca]|uniref:Uncharacterized protein n=1 Tax=Kitasatospora purpeofusca TaxID=67352 RepID=A0ABZ1TYC2_9ACTN|nr:hypothetical protein [Kitasatospora purpeofusca]
MFKGPLPTARTTVGRATPAVPRTRPSRFRPVAGAGAATVTALVVQPYLPGAQDYISGKGIVPAWAPWAGAVLGLAVAVTGAGVGERLPAVRGGSRRAALWVGWTACVLLLWTAVGLVFDVFRAFFWATGIPAGEFAAVDWPGFLTRVPAFAATVLLGRELLNFRRVTSGGCEACGHTSHGSTRPTAWLGYAAAGLATVYPSVKYYWWAGGSFGRPETYLEGFPVMETVLLVGGVVLALALVRPWGRVYPFWIPFLAGRQVERRICVVAGWGLAALLSLQGLIPLFAALNHVLGGPPMPFTSGSANSWVITVVYGGWALFGLALAGATHAYQQRTRPDCALCGF